MASDEAQSQIEANPFHLVGNKTSFASLASQTIAALIERQLRHIRECLAITISVESENKLA